MFYYPFGLHWSENIQAKPTSFLFYKITQNRIWLWFSSSRSKSSIGISTHQRPCLSADRPLLRDHVLYGFQSYWRFVRDHMDFVRRIYDKIAVLVVKDIHRTYVRKILYRWDKILKYLYVEEDGFRIKVMRNIFYFEMVKKIGLLLERYQIILDRLVALNVP